MINTSNSLMAVHSLQDLAPFLSARVRFKNNSGNEFTGRLGHQIRGADSVAQVSISYDKTPVYPSSSEMLTDSKLSGGNWQFQKLEDHEFPDLSQATF